MEFSFPDSGAQRYALGTSTSDEFYPGHFFKYSSDVEFEKLDSLLRQFTDEVGARWPLVEIWAMDWQLRGFGNRDYPR